MYIWYFDIESHVLQDYAGNRIASFDNLGDAEDFAGANGFAVVVLV